MTQTRSRNRKIVLASRPQGAPQPSNFRLEESAPPDLAPGSGQILLRTVFLSLDPYMRGRMSDAASYSAPVGIDQTMEGGTISRVVDSQHKGYQPGDWVLSGNGWQDYAVSDSSGLINLGAQAEHPSYSLGVLGMPGFTGYMGLLDIGAPKAGETLVVAAATGAVGSVVGQVAKLKGCRVVGIAGGAEKCRYAVQHYGFDVCLDHRAADLAQQLAAVCPSGIDIYFENVGGKVFEAVLPLLNTCARVPVCGLISGYNASAAASGPDHLPLLMRSLLTKRMRMQGFIIFQDYGAHYSTFYQEMKVWVAQGHVKTREDIVAGLENAPQAFMGLLEGKNFGKLIVRVGRDES